MRTVIDLEGVKMPTVNNKFGLDKKRQRLFTKPEYKEFKKLITLSAIKGAIQPPYRVHIYMETRLDYDNALKPIADGLQDANVITDDKYIVDVHVVKKPVKQGSNERLIVKIGTVR